MFLHLSFNVSHSRRPQKYLINIVADVLQVGDFQVPIALGTQTGGSTIRPGSFNGIYAFKPTWGAISREGLSQFSMTCDTLGLFARSVADLELLASVFQLEDDEPSNFSLKGAKVAFCKTQVWHKARSGTKAAWEKAKSLLEGEGAAVEELELPEGFGRIVEWHRDVLAGEGRTSFLGSESSLFTPNLVIYVTDCEDENANGRQII